MEKGLSLQDRCLLLILQVASLDHSILCPYKALHNATATAWMTGGFVFVTWRRTKTTMGNSKGRGAWEWLELAETGHLFEQQTAGSISVRKKERRVV